MLTAEGDKKQVPVYFVSWILQGIELKYSLIEKFTLSLVQTARQLRTYFQAHLITVLTDQPIRQILMEQKNFVQITK